MRLRFVEAVGWIEGFALRDIGWLGHGQANAANEFDVYFAFGAATDIAPAIALKMKDDGDEHGGRDRAMEEKRIDEEAAQTEIVGISEGRIGGGGHVIGCAPDR